LKAALKKPDIIPGVICLCLAVLPASLYAVDGGETCHAVDERAVVLYRGDTAKRIPVEGRIVRSVVAASGIYYCADRGEKGEGELYLGFVDFLAGSIGFERKIPIRSAERTVTKLMAGDDAAYILSVPVNETGAPGDLFRVPAPPGEVSRVTDVLDFYAEGADCYLLSKTDSGARVVLNERSVPLSLQGEESMRIREVLDRRLVLVSLGEVTEIIDMRTGRSLYQYATNYDFLEPDGFNMIIQAVDGTRTDQDDREMIFYKVIIDGVESGRTDSGPAGLAREMKLMLEPNRYHQVRLERWILNPGKGRYDRENNIRQPRMKEIYIPMNRIVKLVITFNNKDYSYTIAPVYR
jgi:hypothetical protein